MQAAFAVSTRRVAGLMLLDRSTMSYRRVGAIHKRYCGGG
jgi:hypothetical protein